MFPDFPHVICMNANVMHFSHLKRSLRRRLNSLIVIIISHLSLSSSSLWYGMVQGQESVVPGIVPKLLGCGDESELEEVAQEEPPASLLHSRRQALVPPKLITDGYESAGEDLEPSYSSDGGGSRSQHSGSKL